MSTTNLLANQVPGPLGPSSPLQRNAMTGLMGSSFIGTMPGFQQFQTAGTAQQMNELLCELANAMIGSGLPWGVIAGLALAPVGGLNVQIGVGVATGKGILYVPAALTEALNDNSSNYVWLKNDATQTHVAGSLTPPANAAVYLGCVTTVSGSITGIDIAGVGTIVGGAWVRTTGDAGAPNDTPSSYPLCCIETITLNGRYRSDGSVHHQMLDGTKFYTDANGAHFNGGHLFQNYNLQTLSASLTLANNSPNYQYLKVTAADEKVIQPSNTGAVLGQIFYIFNDANSTHNLLIRDHGDTTTLCTITPGQMLVMYCISNSGTPTWPHTGLTPVTSPTS